MGAAKEYMIRRQQAEAEDAFIAANPTTIQVGTFVIKVVVHEWWGGDEGYATMTFECENGLSIRLVIPHYAFEGLDSEIEIAREEARNRAWDEDYGDDDEDADDDWEPLTEPGGE
jgi:hypothetical protein